MNWTLVAEVLGYISVLAGAIVFLGAGIGLVRFRDLYMRSSALATASSLGLIFIITGAFLLHPEWQALPKVILAGVFQLASSAIGSMAIARAGFLSGAEPSTLTRFSQVEFLYPDRDDVGTRGRSDDGRSQR